MTLRKKSFFVTIFFLMTKLSIGQVQPFQLTTNIKANVIENLSATLIKNYIFQTPQLKWRMY